MYLAKSFIKGSFQFKFYNYAGGIVVSIYILQP